MGRPWWIVNRVGVCNVTMSGGIGLGAGSEVEIIDVLFGFNYGVRSLEVKVLQVGWVQKDDVSGDGDLPQHGLAPGL